MPLIQIDLDRELFDSLGDKLSDGENGFEDWYAGRL